MFDGSSDLAASSIFVNGKDPDNFDSNPNSADQKFGKVAN